LKLENKRLRVWVWVAIAPLTDVIDLALVDNPEIYFKSAREFKQALSRGGILEL